MTNKQRNNESMHNKQTNNNYNKNLNSPKGKILGLLSDSLDSIESFSVVSSVTRTCPPAAAKGR